MEKIYEKGSNTHVGSFKTYAYNGGLYEDADHTKQIKAADALQAFQEGKLQIALDTDLLMASKISSLGATVYAGGTGYSTDTE